MYNWIVIKCLIVPKSNAFYIIIYRDIFSMTWRCYMRIVNICQFFDVPFILSGTRFWRRMAHLCEAWLLWLPLGNLITSTWCEKYARHRVRDFENQVLLNHTCMLDFCIPKSCCFVWFTTSRSIVLFILYYPLLSFIIFKVIRVVQYSH